jgi:L-threonylcarbamoyladenylate synthase
MITTDIKLAASFLTAGEVVAIPTETVYGLAGNIYNDAALERIFRIKKRPMTNPLIVHIPKLEAIDRIAKDIPEMAWQLGRQFWPGALTMVLPKQSHISGIVSAGKSTVAVRVPDHPVTQELLGMLNFPLAAPSANSSGYISPTTALHVYNDLNEKVPLILDGGSCNKGIESTILGFEDGEPVVYRMGSIPVDAIEKVTGKIRQKVSTTNIPIAPGMFDKHYAPHTPFVITDDIHKTLFSFAIKFKHIGVMIYGELPELTDHKTAIIFQLSLTGSMEEAAQRLYDGMHQLDAMELDLIIALRFPETALGNSLNDRLQRASFQHR